jgi:hypothetical protein
VGREDVARGGVAEMHRVERRQQGELQGSEEIYDQCDDDEYVWEEDP